MERRYTIVTVAVVQYHLVNNMKTPYFKAKIGYGEDDYIEVPESELVVATRAQIEGTVYLGAKGSLSGNSIIAIVPDMLRMAGYNRGYKPTPAEWEDITNSVANRHAEAILSATRDKILGRVSAKQIDGPELLRWSLDCFVPEADIAIITNIKTGEKIQVSREEVRAMIERGEIIKPEE